MVDEKTQAQLDEVRRDRIVWTSLIVLGVIVTAALLWLGWGVVEGRLSAAKRLDQAMALLKAADSTMLAVDEVIRAEVSPATAARAREVMARIAIARSQLVEAKALVGSDVDRLTDDEQEQAALALAAATADIEMLDSATPLLSATAKAAESKALAEEAWTKTLAADQLARQSISDRNKLTRPDVENAAAANDNAKEGFTAAQGLFGRAHGVFPQAKLDVFVAYVDDRLALIALARKADEAWLAGKTGQANRLIVSYNEKDAAVAASAKKLPSLPADAVAAAYRALAEAPNGEYVKARKKAAEANEALKSM